MQFSFILPFFTKLYSEIRFLLFRTDVIDAKISSFSYKP
jgi:hypothetical protein